MVSKNFSKQETLFLEKPSSRFLTVACFDKFFETILRYIMNILFQNLVENYIFYKMGIRKYNKMWQIIF